MQLSPIQRTFIVQDQVVGAAIVNLLLNALIGWWSFRGSTHVNVWTDPGMALDLSATVFLLPVLLSLVSTPLIRRAVRSGKVGPILTSEESGLVRRLPNNLLLRSLALGIVATVLWLPGLIVLLRLLNVSQVSLTSFVLSKALLAGALAACVAPIVALHVLTEQTARAPAHA